MKIRTITLIKILIILSSFPVFGQNFTIARIHYSGGGDWYSDRSSLPNLLNFLGENHSKNVSEATKNILGFEAIMLALEDLEVVAKGINKELQTAPNDKSIADNSRKRDALIKQIEEAKKSIQQIDDTISALDNQLSGIESTLRNTAGAKEIQKRREQLHKDLNREKDRKDKSDIELVNWIERKAIAAVSSKVTNIANNSLNIIHASGSSCKTF